MYANLRGFITVFLLICAFMCALVVWMCKCAMQMLVRGKCILVFMHAFKCVCVCVCDYVCAFAFVCRELNERVV